jgi:D-alanine transaminase
MSIVYLNGVYLDREAARVSVFDRGFMFGDGVYEVIPAYGGHPFRLPRHLQRLQSNLDAIDIANPMPADRWREVIDTVLERNGRGDQSIYLQVTRGVAERDHVLAVRVPPTVFVTSKPLPPNTGAPVSIITMADYRWQYCNIKAIALLPNVLARQEAARQGAYEAVFVRDGMVTEGAASNVFAVVDGLIMTPPQSNLLLPGVTRDFLLDLLRSHGEPIAQAPLPQDNLSRASEIWLTSSTREIVPVARLNGVEVGGGAPGEIWRKAHAAFQAYKARFVASGGSAAP